MDWKEALLKVPTNWPHWIIQMILAALLVGIYVYFRPHVLNTGIIVWTVAAVLSAIWVIICQRRAK